MINWSEFVRVGAKLPSPRLGSWAAIFIVVRSFDPTHDWRVLAHLAIAAALIVLIPIGSEFLRQRLLR